MKYFLIEITTKEDKLEKDVYVYDTEDDAVANFHTKLGGAMKNTEYLAELVIVTDEKGSILQDAHYERKTAPVTVPVDPAGD